MSGGVGGEGQGKPVLPYPDFPFILLTPFRVGL